MWALNRLQTNSNQRHGINQAQNNNNHSTNNHNNTINNYNNNIYMVIPYTKG